MQYLRLQYWYRPLHTVSITARQYAVPLQLVIVGPSPVQPAGFWLKLQRLNGLSLLFYLFLPSSSRHKLDAAPASPRQPAPDQGETALPV